MDGKNIGEKTVQVRMTGKLMLMICGPLGVLILFLYLKTDGLDRFGEFSLRRTALSEEEVPGVYVAKYPFGTSTLLVSSNHTFAQEAVIVAKNQILRSSGTWRFDSRDGVLQVTGGLSLTNGEGALGDSYDKANLLGYSARRHFWSQRPYIGGDMRFVHEKLDTPRQRTSTSPHKIEP